MSSCEAGLPTLSPEDPDAADTSAGRPAAKPAYAMSLDGSDLDEGNAMMSASSPHRTVNQSHSGRTETDSEQLSNTSSPLFDPDELGTEPSECGDSANPQCQPPL